MCELCDNVDSLGFWVSGLGSCIKHKLSYWFDDVKYWFGEIKERIRPTSREPLILEDVLGTGKVLDSLALLVGAHKAMQEICRGGSHRNHTLK